MDIKNLSFEMREVGKTIKSSKKYYIWEFYLNTKYHKVEMYHSKLSGKKKLILDSQVLTQAKSYLLDFSYSFKIDKHYFNVDMAGDKFQLRVDNKKFLQMLIEENPSKANKSAAAVKSSVPIKKSQSSKSNNRIGDGNFFEENDFEFDDQKNKNVQEQANTTENNKEEEETQNQSNCLLIDFSQPEIEIRNNQNPINNKQEGFMEQIQLNNVNNHNGIQSQNNYNNNSNQQIISNINTNPINNSNEGGYQVSNGNFIPSNNICDNNVMQQSHFIQNNNGNNTNQYGFNGNGFDANQLNNNYYNQNPYSNYNENGFNNNNNNIDSKNKSPANGTRKGSLVRNNSIGVFKQSNNFNQFALNEPLKINNDDINQKQYNEFKEKILGNGLINLDNLLEKEEIIIPKKPVQPQNTYKFDLSGPILELKAENVNNNPIRMPQMNMNYPYSYNVNQGYGMPYQNQSMMQQQINGNMYMMNNYPQMPMNIGYPQQQQYNNNPNQNLNQNMGYNMH